MRAKLHSIGGDWNVLLNYSRETINYLHQNNEKSHKQIHLMIEQLDLIDTYREWNPHMNYILNMHVLSMFMLSFIVMTVRGHLECRCFYCLFIYVVLLSTRVSKEWWENWDSVLTPPV
jgi:hypothetical protein